MLTGWGSVSLIGVAGKASLPVKQPGKPLQPLAKDFAASQTLFDERLHGVVDTFVEGGLGLQCLEACSHLIDQGLVLADAVGRCCIVTPPQEHIEREIGQSPAVLASLCEFLVEFLPDGIEFSDELRFDQPGAIVEQPHDQALQHVERIMAKVFGVIDEAPAVLAPLFLIIVAAIILFGCSLEILCIASGPAKRGICLR